MVARSCVLLLILASVSAFGQSPPTVVDVLSDASARVTLRPTVNMAIDCGYAQPCTGTVCVTQQRIVYCGDREILCQNDTQVYQGGNQICCTGRLACDTCTTTRPDGTVISRKIWSYFGVTKVDCVPNP